MRRRDVLVTLGLAPLVVKAQTPCPPGIGVNAAAAPAPACGGLRWPTQTPSYLSVVPNLAGFGCNTTAGYGTGTTVAAGDDPQERWAAN